jgi:hypothetical protein
MSHISHLDSRLFNQETHRHWSPQSQNYASADILLQYIASGWEPENTALVETYYSAGVRRSEIFYFSLVRDGERVEMPVLANPMVSRLIEKYHLNVLRVNDERGDAH